MDFRGGQAVGALFGFDDHAVSHLRRALRAAKVPYLILGLVRDSYRHDLTLGGFDLDVSRVDSGHDAEHMLSAPMGGYPGRGADQKERGNEESKECHGSSFR